MPSRIVGGAERQIALLIQLAVENDLEVCLIDSEAGIVRDMVRSYNILEKIQFIQWDKGSRLRIKNSIVITQGSYLFNLDTMLDLQNCDVRFWFMHPLSLPHMYLTSHLKKYLAVQYALRRYKWKTYRKQLELLQDHLYFQSDDTRDTLNTFYNLNFNNQATFLLSDYRQKAPVSRKLIGKNAKHFVWLGRLDRRRSILIKKIINDFCAFLEGTVEGKLSIIGDGDEYEQLVKYASNSKYGGAIKFLGAIDYNELTNHLNMADVVFTQGSSIYEGVKANVPVCVIDFYSDETLVRNMPYWFYGLNPDHTLGYIIEDEQYKMDIETFSFDIVVKTINEKSKSSQILIKQQNKLMHNKLLGEAHCLPLLLNKFKSNDKLRAIMSLDVEFRKFREFYLKLRKKLKGF